MKNFTLARMKAIVAFLGLMVTYGTTLSWGFDLPTWVTATAAVLTWVGVYATPNKSEPSKSDDEYQPKRALTED